MNQKEVKFGLLARVPETGRRGGNLEDTPPALKKLKTRERLDAARKECAETEEPHQPQALPFVGWGTVAASSPWVGPAYMQRQHCGLCGSTHELADCPLSTPVSHMTFSDGEEANNDPIQPRLCSRLDPCSVPGCACTLPPVWGGEWTEASTWCHLDRTCHHIPRSQSLRGVDHRLRSRSKRIFCRPLFFKIGTEQ